MTNEQENGTSARLALIAGGAIAAVVAAYGGWSFSNRAQTDAPDQVTAAPASAVTVPAPQPALPATTTQAEPQPADPAIAEPAPIDQAEQAPAAAQKPTQAAPVVPSFDVVRVEPDGSAIVAGKAAPGAKIVLRLDGAQISATTADADGNFVALFVMESSVAPRMLTMFSILPDQTEVASDAEVALAPTQKLAVVADAQDTADAAAPAALTAVSNPPAALLITKDGATVLQPAAPMVASDANVSLTIDTISYTPNGDVNLAGLAAAGSVLRIYLNNAPLADVTVGSDGTWAATMPTIAPGIYTLRADQLAADGTVSARFETPFKRETPEALAAALQTPAAVIGPADTQTALASAADPETAVATDPDMAIADATPVAPTPVAPMPAVTAAAEPTAGSTNADAVVTADATPVAEPATPAPADPKPAGPVSVTVQPGFTLWGIASQQFGDGVLYVQVYQANKDKIRNPDLIYPGQVFVIPQALQ